MTVLTPGGASAYLKVPEAVLLAEAEAGRIPGRKIGTEWRFLVQSLTAWLAAGTPDASSRTLSQAPVWNAETEQEYREFMAAIDKNRDDIDRATGSGKYAAE
ncbi:MAG: helix-turn-helix domain-containing protein [Fimbriiglobus sp.]